MISDLVEMLDRQYAFMRAQEDLDLLRYLPRYIVTISRDVRVLAALDELTQEAVDELAQINSERREIADEAARLLDSCLELFPSEDDRGSEHDASFEQDFGRDYRNSIRQLVKLIATHPLRLPDFRDRDSDRDPLEEGLTQLWHRLPDRDREGFDARVDELGTLIGNQQRRRAAVHRRYELLCFASPGVAAFRTRHRAARLTPAAEIHDVSIASGELFVKTLNEAFSFDAITRRVVYGQQAKGDDRAFPRIAASVRADLDLLHEELRARIALQRSLLTVMHRYRTRAQWYDAAELRRIAAGTKRSEDALTAHFARYMHDNGLNPLTRPMLGPLQPDLLDPHSGWSFYVEAKQYSDDSPKAKLVRGLHQVWDTLGQQRGTPYEVREAFFVVFRLGGPRVALPREVRSEGSTVYPVLIDISDSKTMGSRQRHRALAISEEELLPAVDTRSQKPRGNNETRPGRTAKK